MILTIALSSIAPLIGFAVFSLFLLLAFAVAYAKRDVEINMEITLLKYNR